jgi:hypothetical protein
MLAGMSEIEIQDKVIVFSNVLLFWISNRRKGFKDF